jgi:hypothetical protein
MDSFRLIAVILSMILGLGVTRLLNGFVSVFRARAVSAVDWVPLVWGGCLFAIQLEFWWAINNLPLVWEPLAFVDFIGLVALTLTLFLAPALLLPSRNEDEGMGLRAYFERDGRYGVLFVAAFTLLGFVANVYYFAAPLLQLWALLELPMILLPIGAFLAARRSRRVTEVLTVAYVGLLGLDFWVSFAGA